MAKTIKLETPETLKNAPTTTNSVNPDNHKHGVRILRWEYRQERGGASVDRLNELGNEGWELVNKEQGFVLFKRVKI